MTGRRAVAIGIAVAISASLAVARPAGADRIDDKRREAERLADRIEQLEATSFQLGEDFDHVEAELAEVTADVVKAEARVAELDQRLAGMRSSMAEFAVRSYVYGSQASGLATFLSPGSSATEAAQRSRYSELVLQGSATQADAVETTAEDAARERRSLEQKKARQQSLKEALATKQVQVERSIGESRELQGQVEGELAELVAAEQARRVAAAAQQAQEQYRRQQAASVAAGQSRGGTDTGGNSAASRPAASGGQSKQVASRSRAGANVPGPSRGAGGAVAAALSQVGVSYRYATASPGVAFDCSGLTSWAWSQAGVGLPRNSRAQAGALPGVAKDQAQPGDLIFYYSPISHVGMYVGNGQLVHATRPGDVVKVANVRWDKVVKVARPG